MTGQRAAKVSQTPPRADTSAFEPPARAPSAPLSDARHRQDLVQRAAEQGRLNGTPATVLALRLAVLGGVVAGCAAAWFALAGAIGRALA